MLYQPHFFYRPQLILFYILVKLKFLHPLLPKSLKDKLPRGWNNKMFWVGFKSGGQRIYFDYYCTMREPVSYQPKAVVAPEHRLTEEEMRAFYENGYLEPFDVVSPEEMENIREHVLYLIANADSDIPDYDTRIKGVARSAFNTKNLHLRDLIVRELFKQPAITERCAQLLRPNLLLWRSICFHILPVTNGTPWHQTTTWLVNMKESILHPPNTDDVFQLTCWVALQDTPQEKSCLKVVPGSHKELYPMKCQSSADGQDIQLEIDYQVDPEKIKLLEVKAGQCVIFVDRIVHASTDNITEDERWATVGRVIRTDTRAYTEKMLQEGYKSEVFPNSNEELDNFQVVLLRGEDDYGFNKVLQETTMKSHSS
jgi:ectoine hydroxylase-related dioxygenase (phytanoyl-CoA dioxygenase family)